MFLLLMGFERIIQGRLVLMPLLWCILHEVTLLKIAGDEIRELIEDLPFSLQFTSSPSPSKNPAFSEAGIGVYFMKLEQEYS